MFLDNEMNNKTTSDFRRFYKAVAKMTYAFDLKEEGSYAMQIGFWYDGKRNFKFLPPDVEKIETPKELENKLFNLEEISNEDEIGTSQESSSSYGESSDAS